MNKTLFGLTQHHLAEVNQPASGDASQTILHKEVCAPFLSLCKAAQEHGFELKIASGFRSFDRQRTIWNEKFLGQRPVLDDQDQLIDIATLSDLDKITAIMRFSALPGYSRHHWGCDFDYYDARAINNDYQLQLTPSEYTHEGVFSPLFEWLQKHAGDYGFYFPYDRDRSGISPEPWHLSYIPIAKAMEEQAKQITQDEASLLYKQFPIEGQQCVLDNYEFLMNRFIFNTNKGI